jgi:hypothetical protein
MKVAAAAAIALVACNKHGGEGKTVGPAPPVSATVAATPKIPSAITGDARTAFRDVFGTPPKTGREIGSIEPATNGDPQSNEAGVLVATVGNGRILTAWFSDGAFHVGGPIDLGNARFVATDGPHVCAANRNAMRCAWIDGGNPTARELVGDTTGLWGGPGVFVRASAPTSKSPLLATNDAFAKVRDVAMPSHMQVADVEIESAQKWSVVTVPKEGSSRPRLAITGDGGKTAIADAGAIDRQGWSYGDRLWPDMLVTGALSTELVVAEMGQKQQEIELPWSAAGGFAWSKNAIVLFGKGIGGSGGFMLVEVDTQKVTNVVPPGLQPIIAAGRVGDGVVAVTSAGKVLSWTP